MLVPLAVLTLVVAAPSAQAPVEKIDVEINAKIRKEGMDNSQIMKTMHYLTDVYGPRLTGSPNHENAAKWAVQQMTSWGFKNGHLEPWDFSKVANSDTVREGWLNEKGVRPHHLAGQGQPGVRSAGVDTVDQRHRHRPRRQRQSRRRARPTPS
jgi:hypothetical protein